MLETKQLVKIYKPKKGVPVKALDGVSLKFPDKGMVFLLGKSGSGKSTLLNVLGGLDRYDDGEIIIKGVSSKKFKQRHFDSYRNTYVGFIFQEYNILEEFSVGLNIALALELQGKKATDEDINRILKEVDLEGYGNRNPNELSGGQKQRVAIARALVKNPKIIMADEPSGALDSATGKQVFETLKKLSKEKLVIVVSHDRDFATTYADRIIELADGRVISDTTLCENEKSENTEEIAPEGIVFEGETAKIPISYRLSEEDRRRINEYLDRLENGATLEFVSKKQDTRFVPTVQEDIKTEDDTPFKLIKSKLSLKHAFKIGSGGLRYKKFRLVMTVLLSCVAFVMFGLVDTFTSYDHISATAGSIYDSGVRYAAVNRSKKIEDGSDALWRSDGMRISDEDIKKLSDDTGIEFKGVLSPNKSGYSFYDNIGEENNELDGYKFEVNTFGGIVETNESDVAKFGYELVAGKMPNGEKNEIAISKFIFDVFKQKGYREAQLVKVEGQDPFVYCGEKDSVSEYSDMLGKTLLIDAEEYKIVGIVDTKFNLARYESLLENDEKTSDAADTIIDYVLVEEARSELKYSYTGMMLVGNGFIDKYIERNCSISPVSGGHLYFNLTASDEMTTADTITIGSGNTDYSYFSADYYVSFDDIDKSKILWLGDEKTALGEKDIIVSADFLKNWFGMGELDQNGFLYLDLEKCKSELETLSKVVYYAHYYDYYSYDELTEHGYKIVGVYDNTETAYYGICDFIVMNDSFYDRVFGVSRGKYDIALAIMPESQGDIKALAEYCYTERDGMRYEFNNPASFELDALNEVILIAAEALLYVGLFFAVFASILLSNFIATSISYKKQEIGILRAIGSRGNDVFRIFFAEAFIIAVINFVLACIGTFAVTYMLNSIIREDIGLLVTVLNFGIRQILLVFAVSVFVAFVASFIPVKKIASKRPIDAIRNR